MDINKIKNWWLELSEEQRGEIYQNNNPEATDDDWSDWYYRLADEELEELYNENIEDTSNIVDVDAYISDGEFEARREIERGGY